MPAKRIACLALWALVLCFHSFAQSGKALSLDGVNSFMSVADHPDLDVAPGQTKTITCWIKTTSAATSRIIAKRSGTSALNPSTTGTGGTGYEIWMGASPNAGKVAGNAAAWNTTTSTAQSFSTTTFNPVASNDGSWHHVAVVMDNRSTNKTVTFYVDAANPIARAGTFSGTYDFSTGVAFVVGAATNNSNFFNGLIDDVRVWDRAMTPAELAADMSAVVTGPTPSLLAAWDFESTSGTTVPDVSGNNHPGVLSGNAIVRDPNAGMQYVSTSLLQTELPAGKGDLNQRIIAVNVVTIGASNPVSLTSLRFTMNGTANISDLTNIKIYYTGNSNRFHTTNLFATVTPASGTLTANGSRVLAEGNNYFWIAADVAPSATEGNLIDATCEGITVGGVVKTLAAPNNTVAGSRTILLAHKLLYSGGDGGAANYRIPAIVTANDGSLVTAADKRINGSGDLPANIDIVIRRSTDNGQTWSPALTIADLGGTGASDPALVVDKASGKIICLFATNQGVFGSTTTNPIRIRMCTSMDHGVTWTVPVDITSQVYGAGSSNPVTQSWNAAWVASGRAHQLRTGRIVAAIGVRQTSANQLDNFMIYSDDAGVTWQASVGIAETNGDEAKIIDLNDGSLMMSIRNGGTRRMNISSTQGLTWGTPYNQTDLMDPNCNGDLIRYTSTLDGYDKDRLLHTIPSSATRKNVSVLISYDEGKTWSVKKTVYPQASAYSSLTVLPDGTLGMFYENGELETYQLYFARFSLNWLTNGADTYKPSTTQAVQSSLKEFRALDVNSNAVRLDWKTQYELNTATFEVTRSTDGVNFTSISSVNAAGVAQYETKYTFTDKAPPAGTVYYQLQLVDALGIVTKSEIVSVLSGTTYTSPNARNLNLVYFVPNDVDYMPDYQKRLNELMLWTHNWYGQQMEASGYGYKPFGMFKNAAGDRVKIITIFGSKPKASYPYEGGAGAIMNEINAYFAANPGEKTSDHTLVIIPRYGYREDGYTPTGGPFYGLGKWCFALDYEDMDIKNMGKTDAAGNRFSVWFGGLVHELGHGLNLPHNRQKVSEGKDPAKGMALMWAGNGTLGKSPTFLTDADCAILNANQIFNNNTNAYYGAVGFRLTAFRANYDAGKDAMVVSGKYTSDVPVSDFTYYNDPNVGNEGTGVNKDYNAIAWRSKPINNESFYVEMPLSELVEKTNVPYELKLRVVHQNGTITEHVFSYQFVNGQVQIDYDYEQKKELGKHGWTIAGFSSQETSGEGAVNGRAATLIDNNLATFWHSRWSSTAATYPHWVTIDMGRQQEVKGLSLMQRSGFTRAVKDVEILTSSDGVNFTSQGNFVAQRTSFFQYFEFPSLQTFRYFKVVAKSAWDGQQFASIAELGLYHDGNYAPTFTVPADVTIFKNDTGGYEAGTGSTGAATEVWDDYDVHPVVNYTDATASGACPGETVITRTWKVTDADGAYREKTQTITIKDNLAPVLTSPGDKVLCFNASGNYTVPALTATDNSAIGTVTYTITGATTRTGGGLDASGSFSPGTSTITWTVADECSNSSTTSIAVWVNEPLNATVADVYSVDPGGNANTIYLGYGPSSLTYTVAASGGTAPYSYAWSDGATSPSLVVHPTAAGSYTYTIVVTDALGCTATVARPVSVLDVRCGNDKVYVCHKTASGHDNHICIEAKDVANHLERGCRLGDCSVTGSTATVVQSVQADDPTNKLTLQVHPNPGASEFSLRISSGSKEPITVRLVDIQGRPVWVRNAVPGTLRFGSSLKAGIYWVEVKQGESREVLRMIKL